MGFLRAIGNAICCSSCCGRPHRNPQKADNIEERTSTAAQQALQESGTSTDTREQHRATASGRGNARHRTTHGAAGAAASENDSDS